MTSNKSEPEQELENLYSRLIDLSMRYQALDGVGSDTNRPDLARELNTTYLTLAFYAVQQGQADEYRIPAEIADLVRCGILTLKAIPHMVHSFNEPVVDMCIDEDVVEDALEQLRHETH